MAIRQSTRFEVPFEWAFPKGLLFQSVDKAVDWDRLHEADNQARDEDGMPLWVVTAIDPDEEASKFGRTAEVKVRLAAAMEPTPPPEVRAGPVAVRPVAFTGLTALPYVDTNPCRGLATPHKCRARLMWSYRAAAMVAPDAGKPDTGDGLLDETA